MKEENLCQAFSDALLCKIEDIDQEDGENPQLCSDYVKDIYVYLRQLEVGDLCGYYKQGGVQHTAAKEMGSVLTGLNSANRFCNPSTHIS